MKKLSDTELAELSPVDEHTNRKLLNAEYEQELEDEYKHEIAIREGKRQGIEQGRQEARHAITRKLLEKGCDRWFIAEVTGLTQEQITQIKNISAR